MLEENGKESSVCLRRPKISIGEKDERKTIARRTTIYSNWDDEEIFSVLNPHFGGTGTLGGLESRISWHPPQTRWIFFLWIIQN